MQKEDFQKSISRGEGFLIFSLLLAICVRIGYYFYNEDQISYTYTHSGYLWDIIEPYLHDSLYSLIASSVLVIIIAIMVTVINVKYIIIRERTLLPAGFVLVLFSSHPVFLTINPYYIGILFFLWAMSAMFDAYQIRTSAFACAHICFTLALGSLFVSSLLWFYFIFLIGFSTMRILNMKSFIASLFSFLVLYVPIFTFYLYTENLDAFFKPFSEMTLDAISKIPLISFDAVDIVFVGFGIFVFIAMSINNYMNRHKDRIKTREYILFFSLLVIVTFLLYILLNIQSLMAIYVCFIGFCFLQAHYFALVRNNFSLLLFILCVAFYLSACYVFVLHPITLQTIILSN